MYNQQCGFIYLQCLQMLVLYVNTERRRMALGTLVKFSNCRVLRDHKFVRDDLWVENGKVVNPEKIFFVEQRKADSEIECSNAIVAPGFIDTQINGAIGHDFSTPSVSIQQNIKDVAKVLLSHGVTSFCPTLVTSPPEVYKKILPEYRRCAGSMEGAGVLGLHLEGPFISTEKRGAHPPQFIRTLEQGFNDVIETYGPFLDEVSILTLAPELPNALDITRKLVEKGIKVSLGHSMANLAQGEAAVSNGATFITHLFNAMLPFHHRDPHLVGLLASSKIPDDCTVFYGMITDGIHTDASAIRIAHRAHPKGLVIVTDAVPAMGLSSGTHHIGQQKVEIKDGRAVIAGTDTLCGSIATMNECVKFIYKATDCTKIEALECASLHPAQMLGITDKKGTLDINTDADFIFLDDDLNVHATYIAGEPVWTSKDVGKYIQKVY